MPSCFAGSPAAIGETIWRGWGYGIKLRGIQAPFKWEAKKG